MLADHHVAWLAAHPQRSEAWLKRMLAEGFDIHHMDGNHSNNDPENLVLIEHGDHLALHGLESAKVKLMRLGSTGGKRKPKPAQLARWKFAYDAAQKLISEGRPTVWATVGRMAIDIAEGKEIDASTASKWARYWADANGLRPLILPAGGVGRKRTNPIVSRGVWTD